MVYHERAAWAGLISTVLGVGAYLLLIVRSDDPAGSWLPIMLGTIGGAILLSILITIIWGTIIGVRDRDAATASDMRDEDISRMGGRVEHAFLVVAGLAVLVLCAVRAEPFWIAQTMFAGFAVSSLIGGVARVIAYRRGLA